MKRLLSALLLTFLPEPRAETAPEQIPVYRLKGDQGFITEKQYGFSSTNIENVSFRAVASDRWLPGLIPVFLVEKAGKSELRRRPPQGQENITEPFFFGIASEEERDSASIVGHWRCEAIRADGSKAYPHFEITIDGTNTAARFDQTTEYRFAFITSGTFVENELQLPIEYISERYELNGVLQNGHLSGAWKHIGGQETGKWTAERSFPAFQITEREALVPLYQWKHADGTIKYQESSPGTGWKRSVRPLCRVWKTNPA